MLTVSQARHLAVDAIKNELEYERSEFGTHYLGIYEGHHAFQMEFKWSDGIVVDMCLPIIILVSDSQTRIIRDCLSLEILDYFRTRRK